MQVKPSVQGRNRALEAAIGAVAEEGKGAMMDLGRQDTHDEPEPQQTPSTDAEYPQGFLQLNVRIPAGLHQQMGALTSRTRGNTITEFVITAIEREVERRARKGQQHVASRK